MSLTVSGQSKPAYAFAPNTDENGSFAITGIAPGTYDIAVKNEHTLSNLRMVSLLGGINSVDLGTLREGDGNNDDCVNVTDFSLLATPFGTCVGMAGYDDRADFNQDTCVNLLDFSLLATNFTQCGDVFEATP